MGVLDSEGHPLGEVTSGTFSPTRRLGVALALLDAGVHEGDEVVVDVRGRREPFVVTRPPFVTPGVKEEP
jgi:aminomethyltransferase